MENISPNRLPVGAPLNFTELPEEMQLNVLEFIDGRELPNVGKINASLHRIVDGEQKLTSRIFFGKIASIAEGIQDPKARDRAIKEIAKIEAKFDPEGARKTVSLISNKDVRQGALRKLDQWQMGSSPLPPKTLERDIPKGIKALVQLAQKDLAAAQKQALAIQCERERIIALCLIAELDPKHNFDVAIQEALTYDSDDRDDELLGITQFQAKLDPKGALKTASGIEDEDIQEVAWQAVAAEWALTNLPKAKEVAQLITDEDLHASTLSKIIAVEGKLDFQEAFKTAQIAQTAMARVMLSLELAGSYHQIKGGDLEARINTAAVQALMI